MVPSGVPVWGSHHPLCRWLRMGDPIWHPEQFGGTLCTPAPLCNRETVGTGHLLALGDGTQAGTGSNPGISPIPPGWSKGRDREGWGRGKNRKIKEPPPPRAPGHCFGHCKLDFLKRKCFTGHKLSQKKRGGGGENCAIFLWMEKWGDEAGAARREPVGSSPCCQPTAR